MAVVVLGAGGTWALCVASEQRAQALRAALFEHGDRMAALLQQRIDRLEASLYGVRGMVEASATVAPQALRKFMRAGFKDGMPAPGVMGVGYLPIEPAPFASVRVQVTEVVALAAPFDPADVPRPLGLPWASVDDPAWHAALRHALTADQPVLVSRPDIPGTGGTTHVLMLAVRSSGLPRAPARGLVFMNLGMADLLYARDLTDRPGWTVQALTTGNGVRAAAWNPPAAPDREPALVHRAEPGDEALDDPDAADRTQVRALRIGGTAVALLTRPPPTADGAVVLSRRQCLGLGAALTALLAWAAWLLALRCGARVRRTASQLEVLTEMKHRVVEGVLVSAIDHRVRWVDPTLDLPPGDAAAQRMGGTVLGLPAADNDPQQLRRVQDALVAGEPFHGEVWRRAPDGTLARIALDIQPLRSASGALQGCLAMESDLSALSATVQRWHARAEMSGEWFWQTDARHRFEFSTGPIDFGASTPVLGQRRDEVPLALPPEGGWERLHEAMDRHEPIQGVRYRVAVGTAKECWVEIDGRPRRDREGRFLGYEGVGRDISERLQTMATLRQSVALLDTIFENIPVGVAWKDTEGRYLRVNRSFADLFGVAPDTLPGHTIAEIVDEEAARRHHEQDREVVQGRSTVRYESSQRLVSGRWVDTLMCKAPVFNADGDVMGLVMSVVDITDRAAAERSMTESKELAEAANRAKSAFLATMSHEMRTPMNGVVGMAELLAHTELQEGQLAMLHTIMESAHSLLALIDDVLDFSKIEADRLELERAPLCLTPMVEGVCTSLASTAPAREVRLSLCMAPEVPERVIGDITRLRQIVNNLVGNAIKFSSGRAGQPGVVTVRVRWVDGQLQLSVTDNGIGMEPQAVERLFTPFTQAEVSTTRRFGGTGLGLAICQRLVRLMKGRIEVRSVPGEGSVFTVTLPLPVAAEQPSAASPDLAGLDCLLVDAGWLPVQDLHDWLNHAGARVTRAATLDEAWALALDRQAITVLVHDDDAVTPDGMANPPLTVRRLVIGGGAGGLVASAAGSMTSALGGFSPPGPGGPVFSQPGPGGPVVSPSVTRLDAVRRQPFLRAVAVAGGRASPEAPRPSGLERLLAERQGTAPLFADAQRGPLVLVAEDDPVNRIVILRQLSLLGVPAEFAETGVQALARWREGRCVLLLTDLHMPEMDGYELARRVREEEAADGRPRRPILALTANALRGEAERARAAGMDEYLTKPVALLELKEALLRWLPGSAWSGDGVSRDAAAGGEHARDDPSQGARPDVPLQLSVLLRMVGDDPRTVREVLQDYLDSAQAQAQELRAAFAAGNLRLAAGIAHRLKSSSRAVGALALGDLCAAIEKRGDDALPGAAASSQREFDAAFHAMTQSVRLHLQRLEDAA